MIPNASHHVLGMAQPFDARRAVKQRWIEERKKRKKTDRTNVSRTNEPNTDEGKRSAGGVETTNDSRNARSNDASPTNNNNRRAWRADAIRALTLNINGLDSKKEEVERLLSKHQPDVFCLQETLRSFCRRCHCSLEVTWSPNNEPK